MQKVASRAGSPMKRQMKTCRPGRMTGVGFTSAPIAAAVGRCGKDPPEGGVAVQLTKRGGFKCSESPDGKFVYYTQSNGAGIYRVPVEGGEETLVIDSYKAGWGNFAVVEDGIYFIKQESSGGEAA